ncbi:MAG: hypothetical protein ABR961_08525 [Thermoanaerobaculaceae bacterium]|jgi:hypothetical protein
MSDPRTPRLLALLTLAVGIGVPLVTMASSPLTVLPFGSHAQGSYAAVAGTQGSYSRVGQAAALQGSYAQRLGSSRIARLQSSYSQTVGQQRVSRLQGSYSQGLRTATLQGSYSAGSGRTVVAGTDAAAKLPTRAAGFTILFAAVALGVACLPPRKK